ncbi:hypothetical protein TNCV_2271191 [Trichonephila clavipes]|nr:hypothetical protein TNCV_2271191 [Trichonephila clavipes]
MAHSIGSKPLLLKNFNLHEILNYSAKFSSATGNRSVAANILKGLKLFDANFVSKISFTEPDFLMNDDFFIQGFVKAEMKKKVTYKPSVQIRTTCQWRNSPLGPYVPNSVYVILGPEVHAQMFRSGGQSDVKPPMLSS